MMLERIKSGEGTSKVEISFWGKPKAVVEGNIFSRKSKHSLYGEKIGGGNIRKEVGVMTQWRENNT